MFAEFCTIMSCVCFACIPLSIADGECVPALTLGINMFTFHILSKVK